MYVTVAVVDVVACAPTAVMNPHVNGLDVDTGACNVEYTVVVKAIRSFGRGEVEADILSYSIRNL